MTNKRETTQRIIIELDEVSIEKADKMSKQMINALDIEDLEKINACRLEHVMMEITKLG